MPKPPPMSGAATRTLCSGMPRCLLKMSCIWNGDWCEWMTVSEPSPGLKSAIRPRASKRHRHLPLEAQLLLDDEIGLGEGLGRLALLDGEIEGDVVAELGRGSTGAPGAMACIWSPTAGSGSHSIVDKLGGVLGLRAALGRRPARPAGPARPRARRRAAIAAPSDARAGAAPRRRTARIAD